MSSSRYIRGHAIYNIWILLFYVSVIYKGVDMCVNEFSIIRAVVFALLLDKKISKKLKWPETDYLNGHTVDTVS